jgi:hypothetical protein
MSEANIKLIIQTLQPILQPTCSKPVADELVQKAIDMLENLVTEQKEQG